MNGGEGLLRVRGLKVVFPTEAGILRAVEGIDLDLAAGECAALVGESGCGKTVSSQAILRLLNTPPAVVKAREIRFGGREIQDLPESEMCRLRGREVGMVFQDALTALNPVMSVGRQLDEVFIRHGGLGRNKAREATLRAMEAVGIPAPDQRSRQYPHQLSGGMRQRVLIAMAFAAGPRLIIADEPTTALDVTIQMQVLELLRSMQREKGTALLLITHDLSVVNYLSETIHVMYSGRIVETAPVKALLQHPFHPYSQGLLASVPRLDACNTRYFQIPDQVPSPLNKPDGCHFHPRCRYARERCRREQPALRELYPRRRVRCHYPLCGEGGH